LTPEADGSIMGQAGSRPLIRLSRTVSLGDWVGLNRSIRVSNLELRSTANQSPLTVGVNPTATDLLVDLNTSTPYLAAVTTTPGSKVADSVVRAAGTGAPAGVQVVPIPSGGTGSTALLNDTVVATGPGSFAVEVTSCSVILLPGGCRPFVADASLVNVIAHGAVAGLATTAANTPPADCAPPSVVSATHSNYNGRRAGNGQVTNGGHNQIGPARTNPAVLFASFPRNLHERPGAPTINAAPRPGSRRLTLTATRA
jgi:hypothetical protein